jgi:multidrug efflux pump subunit AcrA (membrane-fusion protein)
MKKKVKLIVGVVIALALAASAAAYALTPLKVPLKTLTTETANVTFTEQGVYDYSKSRQVYPIVAGELLEVYVQKGDTVKKGDRLALVSATQYESQVAQLESSVRGYKAQISDLQLREQQGKEELSAQKKQLTAQMQTLEAQIEKEKAGDVSLEDQIDFQRTAVGANKRVVHYASKVAKEARDMYGNDEPEYISAQQALATAQSALSSSMVLLSQLEAGVTSEGYYEGQVEALQAQIDFVTARMNKSYTWAMIEFYNAQIEGAQAGIDQLNEMLGKAEITAPADGVISETLLGDVNLVSQAAQVATKVDLKVEKQLGDETVGGNVTFVAEQAEARMSSLGIEERKVRVLISPDAPIQIGASMDVSFRIYSQPNAVVVPKSAVFERDGQDYVWLADGGKLSLRAVTRGVETREGYIIDEGLSAGDMIVTDANEPKLAEGKKVAEA